MKKYLIAGAVLIASFGAASTASASSNVCIAPDRCVATTSEQHVDIGVVKTGAKTTAAWRLRCVQGSHNTLQTGTTDPATTDLITPELSNPNCKLRALGLADGRAKVRVALR